MNFQPLRESSVSVVRKAEGEGEREVDEKPESRRTYRSLGEVQSSAPHAAVCEIRIYC